MKLTTLKPTLSKAPSRLTTLTLTPGATQRTRGRKWMEMRETWLRAHPLCIHCQAEGHIVQAQQVDHIVELADGGDEDESNYQSLCIEHHKAKTEREAARRAQRRGG